MCNSRDSVDRIKGEKRICSETNLSFGKLQLLPFTYLHWQKSLMLFLFGRRKHCCFLLSKLKDRAKWCLSDCYCVCPKYYYSAKHLQSFLFPPFVFSLHLYGSVGDYSSKLLTHWIRGSTMFEQKFGRGKTPPSYLLIHSRTQKVRYPGVPGFAY